MYSYYHIFCNASNYGLLYEDGFVRFSHERIAMKFMPMIVSHACKNSTKAVMSLMMDFIWLKIYFFKMTDLSYTSKVAAY